MGAFHPHKLNRAPVSTSRLAVKCFGFLLLQPEQGISKHNHHLAETEPFRRTMLPVLAHVGCIFPTSSGPVWVLKPEKKHKVPTQRTPSKWAWALLS
eukprot:1160125-Pelagomonas_calceolata.AAC.15